MSNNFDPAHEFINRYRQEFADAASEYFEKAVSEAKIDEAANAALAGRINKLIAKRDRFAGRKRFWITILVFLVLGVPGWGVFLWYKCSEKQLISAWEWLGFGAFVLFVTVMLFTFFIPSIKKLGKIIELLNTEISEKIEEAREQLRPLFEHFFWNTLPKLVEKVLPMVEFDDFISASRVSDLCRFGVCEALDCDRSVLFTHSGSFYGYPFVFLHNKKFFWSTKTYYGSKTIFYQASERGSDGKYRTVTKSQTLTASVTRPYPEFTEEKSFTFGHDAAPDLSFSRTPSSLSGQGGSFFSGIGKKFKMAKLRRLEQNLKDDLEYTMMNNHDFELLFCSTDRDHEIQYRMLFTPLAQQYMVNLLNDRIGYGDDFCYYKDRMRTVITSDHLSSTRFSTEPLFSEKYDLSIIRKYFQLTAENFFKSIYFTFAPLFTIPLYTEPRLKHDMEDEGNKEISSWEMESIVNYHGIGHYKHPDCVTDCILKVGNTHYEYGKTTSEITAYGFRAEPRVSYITVRGDDNKNHSVRVDWFEYIEVRKNSQVSAFRQELYPDASDMEGAYYRRSTISFLPH